MKAKVRAIFKLGDLGRCLHRLHRDCNAAETPAVRRARTPTTSNPIRGFYAAPELGDWHMVDLGTEFTEIQRLRLPAGRYIVNAAAQFAAGTIGSVLVDCRFTLNGVQKGYMSRGAIGGTGSNNNLVTIPLTVGFSISSNRNLGLECRAEFPLMVVSQPSPITAIRVNELVIKEGIGF